MAQLRRQKVLLEELVEPREVLRHGLIRSHAVEHCGHVILAVGRHPCNQQ
jgi:hypothetical protein